VTWLVSFIVAVISGISGLFLAGLIASGCVSWYHVPSREGEAGYYVVFLALGGGVAGSLVGFIAARISAAQFGPGFFKELGCALAVLLVLGGISALICRILADVPPELDGRELILEVEFRFPNTSATDKPPTAAGEWDFSFASLAGGTCRKREYGEIHRENARLEDGRWIVPVAVSLFTERGGRSVAIAPKNSSQATGFLLPLPRRPGRQFLEWSDWIPRRQPDGQPWPPNKMSCRFRVQKTPPPPPAKSQEEVETATAAAREAEFNAIPPSSPIEAWFPYIAYDQPQTQRALRLINNHTNLVSTLAALAVSDDPEQAHAALRCISQLPSPPRELIPAVQAAGRVIAARIAVFNNTPPERDPNFALAVDPATRFYGWRPAAETLRAKCGADLTPELKEILDLSRVRPESHCMRMDICRVASYYLQQWAGIAPLPGDPKPR
jgi:hypothetical protein